MSTFAEWKKTNKVMDKCIPEGYQAMAYVVAQAAYKAGERQGRKDAEDDAANLEWLKNDIRETITNRRFNERRKK